MKKPATKEDTKKVKSQNAGQKKKAPAKEKKKKEEDQQTNGDEPRVNGVPPSPATPVESNEENTNAKEKVREKPMKPEDASIFEHFKQLTNEDEQVRQLSAIRLIICLSKTADKEKHTKEVTYALKRLVRGCGASTNASRAGFYTALVALLNAFPLQTASQQVLEVLQKELHVGGTITNKVDADAVVGKILTIRALFKAMRVPALSADQIKNVTGILLQAAKYRTYHASLAYSVLIEFNDLLSDDSFKTHVWPLVEAQLNRPWPKQTLQSVHLLMAIQRKYPKVLTGKYMKAHFGGEQLLNESSFEAMHRIFWDNSNTDILTHPAFELFGGYIATCPQLGEFWQNHVDPSLATPTKLLEIETLKIATDVLHNLPDGKVNVLHLLGDNFMKMLVGGLKTLKQKKDEMLKAFYTEFVDALVGYTIKLADDSQKVAVIRRIILPPGIFDIETYTGKGIVHEILNSLGAPGVQQIFQLYKHIFLNACDKNPENSQDTWMNFERRNAGYMLQHLLAHKAMASEYEWREEQLKFLLTGGVFYVTDTAEQCKKDEAGEFSKNFGDQCKSIFYTSLQGRMHDLQQEKLLLWHLAEFCQQSMQQKAPGKYFRLKQFDESLQKAWQQMFEAVQAGKKTPKAKGEDKLLVVFHILILNMGLQLFREPEMAGPAIEDLLKCLERTKDKQRAKKKQSKTSNAEEAEPEWIEVVVDLFLHLLSQNANALRNIVNSLFGHLCENLNLSAAHQILSMLDMKDGQNPLSAKGEESDDDEEGEEEDEGDESVAKMQVDSDEEEEDDDEGDDEDDEEDEEEEEEDDEDDDEEVTETDKLRNAISQALMANGAAAIGAGDDDDDVSVDLNDLDEEEGRRLDEALANAFKAMKKAGGGGASQIKKSKSYRVKTTTVMHFRIRVLDLLEIYLHRQPSLLIAIEVMVALFNMFEFLVDKELKPLQAKVETVLTKLTGHKTFVVDDDLREDNLLDYLRLIVEKSVPAAVYEVTNKMRNKCVTFMIGNCNKLAADQTKSSKLVKFFVEYAQDFLESRNPKANITLFSSIFNLSWPGVWDLALQLTNTEARTYRRIQIYQLLAVLYKNTRLQKLDEPKAAKSLTKIEQVLAAHIRTLASDENSKWSAKEFETLLELLITVKKSARQGTSNLCSPETGELVQKIRANVRLESAAVYQKYCAVHKLKPKKVAKANGSVAVAADDSGEDSDKEGGKPSKAAPAVGEKRKASKQLGKLKKQKKLMRLEAVSKGLNGGIAFAAKPQAAKDDDGDDSDDS